MSTKDTRQASIARSQTIGCADLTTVDASDTHHTHENNDTVIRDRSRFGDLCRLRKI